MRHSTPEQLVQRYLDHVAEQLGDLSSAERDEILTDLRSHIEEAAGNLDEARETDVRNVLDRLGDPEDVAREARSRSGRGAPAPVTEQSKTPGALEVAGIILTALFWPIGALLVWLSQRWRTRDKVIATVIPFTATALLVAGGIAGVLAFTTESSTSVVSVEDAVQTDPGPPSEIEPRSPAGIGESETGSDALTELLMAIVFLALVIAAPFGTAVFLAVRLQPTYILRAQVAQSAERDMPAGSHL